jgi:hypothetical protein
MNVGPISSELIRMYECECLGFLFLGLNSYIVLGELVLKSPKVI